MFRPNDWPLWTFEKRNYLNCHIFLLYWFESFVIIYTDLKNSNAMFKWHKLKPHNKKKLAHSMKLIMKWISPFVYMLVYNDDGSVQTLCITRVSALCTKCLHRPIVIINQHIHKGWNSFYIFTFFSCVWILFYQSLSWKWLCFSWKSNGMHSKWKSL